MTDLRCSVCKFFLKIPAAFYFSNLEDVFVKGCHPILSLICGRFNLIFYQQIYKFFVKLA